MPYPYPCLLYTSVLCLSEAKGMDIIMKNRDYKKLVTIATAVALIVESLGAVSSPTLAKDAKTTAQTTTAEKKTTKEKEVSSDSKRCV